MRVTIEMECTAVLDLGQMCATDRRQRDRRQTAMA